MRNIACVGSGPASLVFALAVKQTSPAAAVTIIRRAADHAPSLGFALSDNRRRAMRARLESVLDAPLPVHRWRRADIIRRGAKTSIAGELGGAIAHQALLSALERAAIAHHCTLRQIGDADLEDALAAFDLVAWDGTDTAPDSGFATDIAPHRAFSVCLAVSQLAADRVLEVAESQQSLFLGHGFSAGDAGACLFVEATADAWQREGLLDADATRLAGFVTNTFAHALGGGSIRHAGRLMPLAAAVPRRWRDGNRVLIGGTAMAAHPSFLYRPELALDDALALAAALTANEPMEPALERYDKARRAMAASAARASDLEISWLENLHRVLDLPPAMFAFNALTRSLRVNHRDLEKAAPAFVSAVDREFAGIAAGSNQAPPPPMFVPFTLRGLTLPNRIAVSPMCMYQAKDGTVDDFHLVHLGSRAIGGAGLVFAEMTNVSPEGRISPGCAGLYKADHVEAWRRVVDYVHRHTPAKIAIQLAHAGRRASTALPWQGRNVPPPDGGWETLAPSAIAFCDTLPAPRQMTHADIARVVADFARAASWSEQAGFDLIELHMAHGYLLSTFLSPLSNKRSDGYGGDLEGRARFPLEVVRAVRAAVPDLPLSVRISAVDWSPGGSTLEQMIAFSVMLKEADVDIIDVSTGNVVNVLRPITGRLFQTPFSDQIRNQVKIPTMTVGKIRSYGDINAILAAGRADVCLLAKGYLRQPYFAYDAAQAQGYDLPWPDSYAQAKDFALRDEYR
jgi:anthraniloyl-CoA monooxygenase